MQWPFGSPRQRRSSALILVRKDYTLNAYLSDLGGNDPVSHNDDQLQLMAAATRFLHVAPTGKVLGGPKSVIVRFTRFKEGLQTMADALHRDLQEVHPFREYRVCLALLNEFLRNEQQAGV